jgi:hypothetical protein
MRRTTPPAFLLILLCVVWWTATPISAATCEVDTNKKQWSSASSWTCGHVPTADDTVVVGDSGTIDTMICDCSSGTTGCTSGCIAGQVEINVGSFLTSDGNNRLFVFGEGSTATDYTGSLLNHGVFIPRAGDTVLGNCDALGWEDCQMAEYPGSILAGRGLVVYDGSVASVIQEKCPQGEQIATTGIATAADCEGTTPGQDIGLKLKGITVKDDELNGLALYVEYPAGHRGTWYDIIKTLAPDTIWLDFDSRGQNAAHGLTFTAAANVNVSGTTLTWTGQEFRNECSGGASNGSACTDDSDCTGGKCVDFGRLARGANFVCDADCAPLSNASPATTSEYLPCAAARTIVSCDTASPSVCTLSAAIGGGNTCNAGAPDAARVITEPGLTWPRNSYLERFDAGDPIKIVKTIKFSIPDANKGIPAAWPGGSPADITAHDKHSFIVQTNNSVIDLYGFEMSFFGIRDNEAPYVRGAIATDMTSANETGALRLSLGDMHHNMGNATLELRDLSGVEFNELTLRDSMYTDNAGPESQHGIAIGPNPAFNNKGASIILDELRVSRYGDDGIDSGPDAGWAEDDWDKILVSRSTGSWSSNTDELPSSECWVLLTDRVGVKRYVDVDRSLCAEWGDGAAIVAFTGGTGGTPPTFRSLVSNTVVLNSGYHGIGHADDSTDSFAEEHMNIVNSVVIGSEPYASGAAAALSIGRIYSSFLEGGDRVAGAQSIYGSVLTCKNGTTCNAVLPPMSATAATMENGTQTFRDVLVVAPETGHLAGVHFGRGSDTYPIVADHLTIIGREPAFDGYGVYMEGDGAYDIRNSVFFNLAIPLDLTNGNAQITSRYNYYVTNNDLCNDGATGKCAANGIPSDTDTTSAMDDLSWVDTTWSPLPIPESKLRNAPTSDATFPGARCAGPTDWKTLEEVYPRLSLILGGHPGVYDRTLCKDEDKDGIWDIHDDCRGVYNPRQEGCGQ